MVNPAEVTTSQEPLSDEDVVARVLAGETGMFEIVIVAQGMEAGGHRGTFHADEAERQMVGLIALLPQVVDAVTVPVIATGGIVDAGGGAAALMLGASAVHPFSSPCSANNSSTQQNTARCVSTSISRRVREMVE
jgi:isopentenyl diphosphate isomerase/L-lactate dehydrogenase-like FMN-dependent dehydrogenase